MAVELHSYWVGVPLGAATCGPWEGSASGGGCSGFPSQLLADLQLPWSC